MTTQNTYSGVISVAATVGFSDPEGRDLGGGEILRAFYARLGDLHEEIERGGAIREAIEGPLDTARDGLAQAGEHGFPTLAHIEREYTDALDLYDEGGVAWAVQIRMTPERQRLLRANRAYAVMTGQPVVHECDEWVVQSPHDEAGRWVAKQDEPLSIVDEPQGRSLHVALPEARLGSGVFAPLDAHPDEPAPAM